MKKITVALLITALLLSLTACGGDSSSSSDNEGTSAETITVKMAHTGTDTCLSHQAMQVIADYMEERCV